MSSAFIQDLMSQVNAMTRAKSEAAGQMTLGSFIEALTAAPQTAVCTYEGGQSSPTAPHSYRGFYEQLAFESGDPETVAAVLETAKCAMGQMFEGYKGGDFRMTGNTMVWRACYGECGDRIVGVEVGDAVVTIKTAPYE